MIFLVFKEIVYLFNALYALKLFLFLFGIKQLKCLSLWVESKFITYVTRLYIMFDTLDLFHEHIFGFSRRLFWDPDG